MKAILINIRSKVITIKHDYKPFFFCLTWFFVFSSAHSADMGADLAADIDEEKAKIVDEAATSKADSKQSKTQWTMGIGLGVFDYLLYPGAKQSNRLIFPAPYLTYRSEKFEVDRGIKSFIYNSETIIIDISADFGFPVDSDETLARKGMPDLDFVLQLGPSLEFLLNDKNKNYFDARFEIPLRVAFAVDPGSIDNIGYLVEPRFTLKHQRLSGTGLSHKATFGLNVSLIKPMTLSTGLLYATSLYVVQHSKIAPWYYKMIIIFWVWVLPGYLPRVFRFFSIEAHEKDTLYSRCAVQEDKSMASM